MRQLSRTPDYSLFSWISLLVGAACAVVSAIVLVGWGLDKASLFRITGHPAAVLPNTALLFFLTGIGLLLLRDSQRRSSLATIAGKTIGLLVGIAGFVTVLEHLFHLDFGIDTLLFTNAALKAGTPGPAGRFAIQTAIAFTCAGFCLFFIDRRYRETAISEVFAGGCAFISFLGRVGICLRSATLPRPYGSGNQPDLLRSLARTVLSPSAVRIDVADDQRRAGWSRSSESAVRFYSGAYCLRLGACIPAALWLPRR